MLLAKFYRNQLSSLSVKRYQTDRVSIAFIILVWIWKYGLCLHKLSPRTGRVSLESLIFS